jgi:NAD(P)-dependent dehydrogenase (short-subunit alcohol dehydrogenase family)
LKLPVTPSFRLDNKRAIIIGSSSGIGLGCAVALADAGASVVLAARRIELLNDLKTELKSKGHQAETIKLDITKIDEVVNIIKSQDSFDIMVNSSGLARHTPAVETNEDDFNNVLNVNLKGAYFITKEIAKKLIEENKTGSLINISSQMAHVGGIDRAVYSASKHAVEGFTKSMAMEFGPFGVRVNTICPTFISTPLTAPTFNDPNKIKWIKDKIKLGRLGEVEDIMGAVVYLASDASSLVTGSSLLIDGGWTVG